MFIPKNQKLHAMLLAVIELGSELEKTAFFKKSYIYPSVGK